MSTGRVIPITVFVSVADVVHAVGCSRSQAYAYLRQAARRAPGERGLLRVPVAVWEAFAAQRFPARALVEPGADRPRVRNKRRRLVGDVPPDALVIPITRPRTPRRG